MTVVTEAFWQLTICDICPVVTEWMMLTFELI